MGSKLFTPTVGKFVWIRQPNGEYMRAEKLYWSGDNITVKGADGFIYEIDRNIRDEADAYVVLA